MATFNPLGIQPLDFEPNWHSYVARIAEGDQQALGLLYDATNHIVYGLALRILGNPADAEEVTLDTYSQIWRNAARFDAERGSVAAWLLTMARSRAIDRLRSGVFRNSYEAPLTEIAFSAGKPQADPAAGHQVQTALATLAPEQREAIELAYWFGFSHTELAARLGQPLGTIKTRIRLGMIKLRSQLGGV